METGELDIASPRAAIVDCRTGEVAPALAEVLARCGAWDHLRAAVTVDPAQARVVIVPELGAFEVGSPAAADPKLVETLVDLFVDRGYSQVVIGARADSSSLWAANRDAYALTDLLGYSYVTPAGYEYDIVDLSEDLVAAPFPPAGTLADSQINRSWLEADLRVVVAANRTDDRTGYHLALAAAMRALPHVDDVYHYRLVRPEASVVAELLETTSIHLGVIDAIVSSHGWAGGRAPAPLRTGCILAATDLRLLDRVGAVKMGLDPASSPLTDELSPVTGRIDGDLLPYEGWRNPTPSVLDSTARREASWLWARLVPAWLQVMDTETFPLESPLDAWVNERTAPFVAAVDRDPARREALVAVNRLLAGVSDAVDVARVTFDKDAIPRTDLPLGFDPSAVTDDEFASMVSELEGARALLDSAPTRAPGLRWRDLDGGILFDYRRVIAVPFDEFVGQVDVTRTIEYMNDYLGGRTVVLERDPDGRVVRQAERNVYLPQPNYVAWWGGQPIDVGKIESATYGPDRHVMHWKTIQSLNQSAVADDGIVTFARSDLGTAVTIVGRQQFVLPPGLATVERGLDAEFRSRLVTHAYATFFSRTLANLEAVVEGREIRIGRPWAVGAGDGHEELPVAALERFLEDAVEWFDGLVESAVDDPSGAAAGRPVHVDEMGFTHVGRGSPGRGGAAHSAEGRR